MSNYQNLCNDRSSLRVVGDVASELFNQVLFNSPTKLVKIWAARSRQRNHLARLTPCQLDDIGVSAIELKQEIEKPFWLA